MDVIYPAGIAAGAAREFIMLILGIDTSSSIGSIALRSEAGVIGLMTVSVDLTHSEGLMPAIDALLQRTRRSVHDITAVACVSGPGSYTGLRVGIASAQGIAFAHSLPCVSVNSLEVLAWAAPHAPYPICPLLIARRGWFYARFFRWAGNGPEPIGEELNIQTDDLIKRIQEPTVLLGPGLPPHREMLRDILQEQFVELSPVFDLPRADILVELAAQAIEQGRTVPPEELLPHYLGPSQAELNWTQRPSPTQ